VDLVVTLPALILLSPLIVLVGILIKLDSRGPVLYSQERVGKGGVRFRMYKFRSMVADADQIGPPVSGHRDPRVTAVGRVLRATKLDELPQLLNVMTGDMTLIGPRAEVERYVRHYTPDEERLLEVRPGLTGPGQVYFTTSQAADLDEVEDPDAYYVKRQLHDKLALDLEYLRNRSLAADIGVLASTVRALFGLRSDGGEGK
jgi:lipopolysaccharide/colanic/teichoic acid biosynthesis glycosyltransferase